MKTKFGIFEDCGSPTKLKEYLTEFFDRVKSPKYNSVFIAYPHQAYEDGYAAPEPEDDQLELYIFSLPSGTGANTQRKPTIYIDGKAFNLVSGQQDFLTPTSLTHKEELFADNNELLALGDKNRVWITCDLFHKFSEDVNAEHFIKPCLKAVVDKFINPPSAEELEARLAEALSKNLQTVAKVALKDCENRLKALENELHAQETRQSSLIQDTAKERSYYDYLKSAKEIDGASIVAKIKKYPYVTKILFERGTLAAETSPINIGPLEFGSWKFTLTPTQPVLVHEKQGSVRHPYQYEDGHFCMGGYQKRYVDAISQGNLDIALAICRQEITNYSTETRMVDIEVFLKAIMGKKLDKLFEEISSKHFTDCKTVRISTIEGKTVTYIGLKRSDQEVHTAERAVIEYD